MKKHIGTQIAEIARQCGVTQSDLAIKANVSYPQLNRFFNGKSNLSLDHFLSVLKILDLDINEFLNAKSKEPSKNSVNEIDSVKECIIYLHSNLDVLRQQAHLKQLEMAVVMSKKKIPRNVQEIINNSTKLI
jgi:plasmid maintenance system antidote protein VapI